jgi:hypothetical protein
MKTTITGRAGNSLDTFSVSHLDSSEDKVRISWVIRYLLMYAYTCIVFPFIASTTSPGFTALPEGMFSHKGANTVILMGRLILTAANKAETTHAAPPISPLIKSILADGFIDMPPVSNVTPQITKDLQQIL